MIEIYFKTNLFRYIYIIKKLAKYFDNTNKVINFGCLYFSVYCKDYSIYIDSNSMCIHCHTTEVSEETVKEIDEVIKIFTLNGIKLRINGKTSFNSDSLIVTLIFNSNIKVYDEVKESSMLKETIKYSYKKIKIALKNIKNIISRKLNESEKFRKFKENKYVKGTVNITRKLIQLVLTYIKRFLNFIGNTKVYKKIKEVVTKFLRFIYNKINDKLERCKYHYECSTKENND